MADKTIEELNAMSEAERMAWFADRVPNADMPPSSPEFLQEVHQRALRRRASIGQQP